MLTMAESKRPSPKTAIFATQLLKMAKKKLIRFADIKTMDCVFEPTIEMCLEDSFPLKGKWRKDFFKNDHPLIVELGCGKGEYAVQLGEKYSEKNFVGLDIKGARIWYGANTVRKKKLHNVAFVRTKIEFADTFFGKDEVDEIWLTFSDPQPNKPKKRLTSPWFIDRYRKFLKPGGFIHLKTDNTMLFDWTLHQINNEGYKLVECTWDLYGDMDKFSPESQEILSIRTHYETIFWEKGFDIKYCKFVIS